MRAALVGTIVATIAAVAAMPAAADVKAGVDAWQQGDYARAVAEWRPLAAAGDADAQFNLGQAYKLGRGVPVDLPIAMDWFRKASTQGHERAADNLGLLLFQQAKREEAMPFIRKSAERGEPRAQYILGTAMFNGDMVAKDWVTAYALMTRAAATGLQQAQTSLEAMDKYISADQRQKGLALAARMANDSKTAEPQLASATPKPVAPAPVAAKPQTSQVPPRRPATPAPTPPQPASPDRQAVAEIAPQARPAPPVPRSVVKPPPPTRVAEAAPPPSEPSAAPSAPPKAAKPPGRPARTETALAKPPPSGNWRVQLGAFKEGPRAKALWQNATSKVSGLSAYKLYLVEGGDVTRVQAGPLASQADASRLCGKLQASGYTCLVKQN